MSIRLGDRGPVVRAWRETMGKRFAGYAKIHGPLPGDTDEFGPRAFAWQREYEFRTGQPQDGVVSDNDLAALGIAAAPAARHLGIVFRGTGGIIGQDYVSRTLQPCADLVEEVNPAFAATMGGIPVGTATDLGAPSMAKAVSLTLDDAQRIVNDALAVNPKRRIVIGGYSAGAVAAARLREWLMRTHPEAYLCSFSFGDPTRPEGGAFYRGVPAPGRGISTWRYGDPADARHCWLAAPGDMYTSVPSGPVGDIMDTAYEMVTQFQLTDILGTAQAILTQIPVIIDEAVRAPAAAIQAIDIALRFATSSPPTAAHIQYEFREVWPGMTYLGLAIQHVRDWASRVAAAA